MGRVWWGWLFDIRGTKDSSKEPLTLFLSPRGEETGGGRYTGPSTAARLIEPWLHRRPTGCARDSARYTGRLLGWHGIALARSRSARPLAFRFAELRLAAPSGVAFRKGGFGK